MSKGKYSPTIYSRKPLAADAYVYNALGEREPNPEDCGSYDEEEMKIHGLGPYYEESMYYGLDRDGYDSYGYSSYDSTGKFVGLGQGVDSAGYTEDEYMSMSDEEFADHYS